MVAIRGLIFNGVVAGRINQIQFIFYDKSFSNENGEYDCTCEN